LPRQIAGRSGSDIDVPGLRFDDRGVTPGAEELMSELGAQDWRYLVEFARLRLLYDRALADGDSFDRRRYEQELDAFRELHPELVARADIDDRVSLFIDTMQSLEHVRGRRLDWRK